jgi:hypothetical protein
MFNTLNHPNWGTPNPNWSSTNPAKPGAAFTSITTIANGASMREIQGALKFNF